jgi:hypothetical protein
MLNDLPVPLTVATQKARLQQSAGRGAWKLLDRQFDAIA